MKEKLTHSAMARFLECPKAFYWGYERGLRPADEPEALTFGSHIHDALAVGYRRFQGDEANWDWTPIANPFHEVKFHALIGAYWARWIQTDMAAWEVVGVEQSWTTPLRNPATRRPSRTFELAGKADLVVRDTEGVLWVVEHKTASRIDGGYLDRLYIDRQSMIYADAISKTLKEPVAGVIYNVLGKCPLRELKNPEEDGGKARVAAWYEAHKEDAFVRVTLAFDARQLEELQREVWAVGKLVLDAKRSKHFIKNTGQCLNRYGRVCDYLPLCKYGDESNVIGNYRVQERNPELKEDSNVAPF